MVNVLKFWNQSLTKQTQVWSGVTLFAILTSILLIQAWITSICENKEKNFQNFGPFTLHVVYSCFIFNAITFSGIWSGFTLFDKGHFIFWSYHSNFACCVNWFLIFVVIIDFLQNKLLQNNYFRNAIGVPNGLDSDLGSNCLQRLSADDKSRLWHAKS